MNKYVDNKDVPTVEKLTYNLIDLLYTISSTNDTMSVEITKQINVILDEYEVTFDKVISSYNAMKKRKKKKKKSYMKKLRCLGLKK